MMRTIVVAHAGYIALLPPPTYAQTFVGWSLLETPHFRLQFPPNPHVDSKEFADQLERAYAELQRLLGGAPSGRINFIDYLAQKGGRERLFALLKDQTIERARTIYGSDFDRLVAEFETQLTGVAAPSDDTKLEALRARAQARFRRDREVFTAQEFRDLEALYQAANSNIRAPGGKDLLLQVVSKYPRSNRAGCAVLYLAQISSGSERESFLKRAIEEHGDAWYGDGVQVGALARVHLAGHYAETNRSDEAVALAEAVRKSFPDAVDHTGGSLIEMLQRMKLIQPK